MRICPSCNNESISEWKLYVCALTRFNHVSCSKCYAIVAFEKLEGIAPEFISIVLADLSFIAIFMLSWFMTGSIWAGVAIYMFLAALKALVIYKRKITVLY